MAAFVVADSWPCTSGGRRPIDNALPAPMETAGPLMKRTGGQLAVFGGSSQRALLAARHHVAAMMLSPRPLR